MKSKMKNENMMRTQAYIDGNWVSGPRGKSFPVYNPYDGKKIATVPDLGAKEAKQAVEAAYWAFSAWSTMLAREREQKLRKLADLIQKNVQDLALLLSLEQGKTLKEAEVEVLGAADSINWAAEEARRIHGLTQSDPDENRVVMTMRQPIGVVAVITPWNFPFSIPAERAFSALAVGCTVVIKPSEETPLCALALAYLTQEAGIPAGVFNVVTCLNPEKVGEVLSTHPLVSKLNFTGSTEVGKKLMTACASTVKKMTLELGGNCPVIVFEDANIDKALREIKDLKFFNTGQCCNSINRILVHSSIYDSFFDQFVEMTNDLTVGCGQESVSMGPLINEQAKQKIEDLVADAALKGAEVRRAKKKQKGLLCSPILIKNARSDMRIFSEEIFGPVAVFYSFDTEDEAIAMANDTRQGLASFFFTADLSRIIQVARALEAGLVGINTTNIYSDTLPFGGWKETGIGREGGIEGFLNDYCELKAISLSK